MAKTPRTNDDRVRAAKGARASALKLVPANGAVDDLVTAVGRTRRRVIHLLDVDLGPGEPTGMWIATDQADYVVHPADASAAERTAVICHELAHMLLGHQPQAEGDSSVRMATVVAPDIDPEVAQRFLRRHGYAEPVEAEAEHLGTLLVAQLARNAEAHVVRRDAVSDRLR